MGLIVVEARVLEAVLNARDKRHHAAVATLRAARDETDELVISAVAYAELLVAPARAGWEKVARVDAFLDAVPIRIAPVSREIAARAAVLHAGVLGAGAGALRAAALGAPGEALSAGGVGTLTESLVTATADVLMADQVLGAAKARSRARSATTYESRAARPLR